jgi:hypothetical protein
MKKLDLPSMGKNVFRKLYVPSTKRGQVPGAPVYTGEQTEAPIRIRLMDFSPDS